MSEFRFGAIQLGRQRVTASGDNNLYVNGQLVGTGVFALSNELYQTGSDLYNLLSAASGQFNTDFAVISGVLNDSIFQSGATLSTNLYNTGLVLDNKINSLSGYVDAVSGALQTQIANNNLREFYTGLATGEQSYFISFNPNFSSTPIVNVTVEVEEDYSYLVNVKNRSISGFTALMSDVVFESGVGLNVMASVP